MMEAHLCVRVCQICCWSLPLVVVMEHVFSHTLCDLCPVLCPSLELMSGIMWPYSCQKCLEQLKQEFALVKSKLEHMFEVILLT
jgi:hypothetical protein